MDRAPALCIVGDLGVIRNAFSASLSRSTNVQFILTITDPVRLFRESRKRPLTYSSVNDGSDDIAKPLIVIRRLKDFFGVDVRIVPKAIRDRQADIRR